MRQVLPPSVRHLLQANTPTNNCYAIHCDAIHCNTLDCYAIDCYAIDCYAIDCYAIDCYAIDCYAINTLANATAHAEAVNTLANAIAHVGANSQSRAVNRSANAVHPQVASRCALASSPTWKARLSPRAPGRRVYGRPSVVMR